MGGMVAVRLAWNTVAVWGGRAAPEYLSLAPCLVWGWGAAGFVDLGEGELTAYVSFMYYVHFGTFRCKPTSGEHGDCASLPRATSCRYVLDRVSVNTGRLYRFLIHNVG